ncbi:MAG TPA: alkaline phosphatase family protein [Allosphingosinicella sp.]|nr:alkaline phosphatase family protein [Allosphingosinicella sp.]
MGAWKRAAAAAFLAMATIRPAAAAPPVSPKLIVVIAVDQFSAELYGRYRDLFTGGLKRLGGGIAWPAGWQSHAATETCPGHSTILTGDHPARTGIVANSWFDVKTGSSIYCVAVRGTGDPDARGPQNLRVDTFGDWLKAARPGARVVSISGKDRAAIMLGGHHADAVYWWVDGTGFATSSYAGPAGPSVTAPAERWDAALMARWRAAPPALWPTDIPEDCRALVQSHMFGKERVSGAVPPDSARDVEDGPDFLARTGFQDQFRGAPLFDAVTLDFAAEAAAARGLGKGPQPDLLAISLSATDHIGHRFGNGGAEMCVQMHALDAALGRLLDRIDALGTPYIVVLTADHGAIDAAERASEHGLAARRIDGIALVAALNRHLRETLGIDYDPIDGGDPQQLVINAPGDAAFHTRIRDEAIAWLKKQDGVAEALTADEIVRAAPPAGKDPAALSLAERYHESHAPGRSGDIAVEYARYATLGMPRGPGDYVAGHGSPWDYDRQVPILFWWPGIESARPAGPAETVDIAPTLAAIVRISPPSVDGHCLPAIASCPATGDEK